MDNVQAIEEHSTDMLDHTDFQDTDIPAEIPLPESPNIKVIWGMKASCIVDYFRLHSSCFITHERSTSLTTCDISHMTVGRFHSCHAVLNYRALVDFDDWI